MPSSDFSTRSAWIGFPLLLAVALASSIASAELPSTGEYSSLSDISSGSSTDESGAFDNEAGEGTIATVGHTVPLGGISSEMAVLRSRLDFQDSQIDSLRSQLQTPSTKQQNVEPRWFTTYESVIVQPLQENTTGVIVETDNGYSHVAFPWKLEHSPRIQFGRESVNDLVGWRVRYWHFRHSEAFNANDANGVIPTGNDATVGYLSEDGDITIGLDFIEEGRFASSIRTDVIDWEFQRHVASPVDLYAGIRYAKVAQRFSAHTDQGIARASSSFRGIGPTIAMRIQHPVVQSRVSLFANLRGSLLFGHKDFSVIDDANNVQQSIGNDDVGLMGDGGDTLSGNTEMQVGLRLVASDWLALTVAFEAQNFMNVGGANPTGVFTGPDSGLAGASPMDDSLSFAGVTVGTEVTW